jgi:hypothetical protein
MLFSRRSAAWIISGRFWPPTMISMRTWMSARRFTAGRSGGRSPPNRFLLQHDQIIFRMRLRIV